MGIHYSDEPFTQYVQAVTSAQVSHLRSFGRTTKQTCAPDTEVISKPLSHPSYLLGKLSSRHQHQTLKLIQNNNCNKALKDM